MGTEDLPLLARDFDSLETGERFTTQGRTITEADVVSFAALTGDRHPQHVDAAWARNSRFGERVAHGMLIISYAAGLVPFDPERVIALRRLRDVVFKRPARLGETIHVEGRIEEAEPLDDHFGLVAVDWKVLNERGKTVARARVEVLWRRGDAPPPEEGEEGGEAEEPDQAVVPL